MQELNFAFIRQRIKEICTEKKLTQEYLANTTDVNVSHISNIETNKGKDGCDFPRVDDSLVSDSLAFGYFMVAL